MADSLAGRPDKLTEERARLAVEAYRQGASHDMAADCVGVSKSTVREWIQRGIEEMEAGIDSKYVSFSTSVKQARYEYEKSLCADIEIKGRDGAWQANAWLLERRNPDAFGRNALELAKINELHTELEALKEVISNKFHGGNKNELV